MKITDLLSLETMQMELKGTTKDEVLDELITLLVDAGKVKKHRPFKKAILAREKQGSTGVGNGIAIPHAKNKTVLTPALAFGISKEGVDFNSLDGEPAHLFFMIAVPEGEHNLHLTALSKLARFLMHDDFKNGLLTAKTKDEVLALIEEKEKEKE
mgnify:CR=1 FL=1